MFSGFSAVFIMMTTLATAPQSIVLEFSSPTCVPCQTMIPIVHKLQQEGYAIQQVNVFEQPQLAQKFRIRMYPTFVVIKNGQEMERIEGVISEGRMREIATRFNDAAQNVNTHSPPDLINRQGLAGMTIAHGATGYERSNLGNPGTPQELRNIASNQSLVLPAENNTMSNNSPSNYPYNRETDSNTNDRPLDKTRLDKLLPDINFPDKKPIVRGQNEASPPGVVKPFSNDLLLSSTVRIHIRTKDGVSYGTGTIIESKVGNTVILTCAHILRNVTNEDKIQIDFYTDKSPVTLVGKPLATDVDADVGIIVVPSDLVFPTTKVASLDNACRLNDPVVSYGCSGGRDPTKEEHNVTACNKYVGPDNIECTGLPTRGRSGGGLFNLKGEVIGVCSAADPQSNRGLYSGLPPILKILTQNKISLQNKSTSDETSIASQNRNNNGSKSNMEPVGFSSDSANTINAALPGTEKDLGRKLDNPFGEDPMKILKDIQNSQASQSGSSDSKAEIEKPSRFNEFDHAKGARLTIIIEVPGSPDKTRTVIVPVASEKLIQEITRDNKTASRYHTQMQNALRTHLFPTDLTILHDTIQLNHRKIRSLWSLEKNDERISPSPVEVHSQTSYSLIGFKKYQRSLTDVARNSEDLHNSRYSVNYASNGRISPVGATAGSYGLISRKRSPAAVFSIRHPSIRGLIVR